MKRTHKAAAGIVAALSLGLASAAFAHQGAMGEGQGPHAKEGMQGGMPHGMMGGMGAMHSAEHTALREKMRNAKTPEERQKAAEELRSEMQKRSEEHKH